MPKVRCSDEFKEILLSHILETLEKKTGGLKVRLTANLTEKAYLFVQGYSYTRLLKVSSCISKLVTLRQTFVNVKQFLVRKMNGTKKKLLPRDVYIWNSGQGS